MDPAADLDNLRDEIALLEARIEELAERLESCRKFVLAARVTVAAGGIVLVALFSGVLRFDPAVLAGAAAALLGGFVVWGSNRSTANEARQEIAEAEADRAALIARLDLHTVAETRTLH